MKRKKAFIFGIIFAAAVTAGCSGNKAAGDTEKDPGNPAGKESKSLDGADGRMEEQDRVFGRVTETGEGYIIVEREERPEGTSVSKEADDKGEEEGANGQSKETQEIKADDDTVIRRISTSMPEGEERPGESNGEMPDGEKSPQAEDGRQPPDIQGKNGEGQKPDKEPSRQPGNDSFEDEGEEITLKDITVGVQVSIALGDDGIADKITVMEKESRETAEKTAA